MSVNNRIFYACQAVSLSGHGVGPSASSIVKGVQSVGITSNFTLDQAFELGQAEIYENIMGDNNKAKEKYEELLLKAPNSIFINIARERYRKLRQNNLLKL